MSIIACSLLAFAAGGDPAGPDTSWPHLRGPAHNGAVTSSCFEGGQFSLSLLWRAPLGAGYSGIAVADGVVVTMGSLDGSDIVIALDADSGAERWHHVLGPMHRGHDGSDDGPLSTPLVHRGAAYALSPRGRLVALELASGRPIWSRDLVADFGSAAPPRVEVAPAGGSRIDAGERLAAARPSCTARISTATAASSSRVSAGPR